MEWLTPEGAAAAESRARDLLESALKHEPDYVPVQQAYCRLLMTTNYFVESLVACQKVLLLQPWDGATHFHMGISRAITRPRGRGPRCRLLGAVRPQDQFRGADARRFRQADRADVRSCRCRGRWPLPGALADAQQCDCRGDECATLARSQAAQREAVVG